MHFKMFVGGAVVSQGQPPFLLVRKFLFHALAGDNLDPLQFRPVPHGVLSARSACRKEILGEFWLCVQNATRK